MKIRGTYALCRSAIRGRFPRFARKKRSLASYLQKAGTQYALDHHSFTIAERRISDLELKLDSVVKHDIFSPRFHEFKIIARVQIKAAFGSTFIIVTFILRGVAAKYIIF